MDYRDAFAISKVGMALEQARLETATLNLANMNVPAKPGAEVYRAQRVVAVERGDGSDAATFAAAYGGELRKLGETQVLTTQTVDAPARMVLDPGHPDADERGFVAYPAPR
jgi:flagellar basal-body rod protein FlgC